MSTRPDIFEMGALGARRDRAMRKGFVGGADFLWRAAAERIAERIEDASRAFADVAVLGTGAGVVAEALPAKAGTGALIQVDPSAAMAAAARAGRPGDVLVDPCETLPLAEGSVDLALSVMLMHWQNDPVGHLVQLNHALRPDGLMIAAMLGGRTLAPLRAAFATAEAELIGGITPRVAPMGEIRELGALLQRAGFAMPVADSEILRVRYTHALALMRDLRAMGETNILSGRARGGLRRDVLARAAALVEDQAGSGGGGIEVAFELVFLTGWAPAPGQPRPLRPGSARTRLAEALGTVEIPAGEKTPRGGA